MVTPNCPEEPGRPQRRRPSRTAAGPAAMEALEPRLLLSDVFFLHQSTGQGIMDDHGGHPGLVAAPASGAGSKGAGVHDG